MPMLEAQAIHQVRGVLGRLGSSFTLRVERDRGSRDHARFCEFVEDVASTCPLIHVDYRDGVVFRLSILKDGHDLGIAFRGIPNGHEFTSLLLALLNADGTGRNPPAESLTRRIQAIEADINLKTYVSLTCTNCPDVVQALNVMALLNPHITSEMVDGGLCQEEMARLGIQAVPTVYANGELLHIGRGDLGTLLEKIEERFASAAPKAAEPTERHYDLTVLGGGPAGAAAAIYAARKGLSVAVVAQRIGGQVNDTTGIENVISVAKTTGRQLAADLAAHLEAYPIDVFTNRRIVGVDFAGGVKHVEVKGGETFLSPHVIIATGAGWRRLGLEGEEQLVGHGVHFCPHCDGPFYKGRRVAVIGGGNSGVEAAIDLARICSHVTLYEFGQAMKADEVLQQKLRSLPNVDIHLQSQTTALSSSDGKLTGIDVRNLATGEVAHEELDGVFVQIALQPNSSVFKEALELNSRGEIIIDSRNHTSAAGVYAAGDVTTVPFKQIMIAMGEGAKAALSAFEDSLYDSNG